MKVKITMDAESVRELQSARERTGIQQPLMHTEVYHLVIKRLAEMSDEKIAPRGPFVLSDSNLDLELNIDLKWE